MAQPSEVGGAAAAGHSDAELCAVVVGMRLVYPAGDFRDYVVRGVFRKSNRVAQRGGDVKIIRAVIFTPRFDSDSMSCTAVRSEQHIIASGMPLLIISPAMPEKS